MSFWFKTKFCPSQISDATTNKCVVVYLKWNFIIVYLKLNEGGGRRTKATHFQF